MSPKSGTQSTQGGTRIVHNAIPKTKEGVNAPLASISKLEPSNIKLGNNTHQSASIDGSTSQITRFQSPWSVAVGLGYHLENKCTRRGGGGGGKENPADYCKISVFCDPIKAGKIPDILLSISGFIFLEMLHCWIEIKPCFGNTTERYEVWNDITAGGQPVGGLGPNPTPGERAVWHKLMHLNYYSPIKDSDGVVPPPETHVRKDMRGSGVSPFTGKPVKPIFEQKRFCYTFIWGFLVPVDPCQKLLQTINSYHTSIHSQYNAAWGPNCNTFVQKLLDIDGVRDKDGKIFELPQGAWGNGYQRVPRE